jgi:hypothetical protein
MKEISKIVALSVRNNMEDFHVKYLTDNQMKELNPLIRKGVYEALFALANCNKNDFCKVWVEFHTKSIPDYWEEPELEKPLKEVRDKLDSELKTDFKSPFLNEQFKLGNLFHNATTGCIEMRPAFEFKEVVGDARKI